MATEGERERSRYSAHFFPVYQQLDEQLATPGAELVTLAERNRAAASAAVGIDVIDTTAPATIENFYANREL